MSGVYLSERKARGQYSGWSSWTSSFSGADYISEGNNAHAVIKITNSTDSGVYLQNLRFGSVLESPNQYEITGCTLKAYLYASDPTVNNPTTPPSDYIRSYSETVTVKSSETWVEPYFNGIYSKVSPLYVWITITNDHPYGTVNIYHSHDYVDGDFGSQPTVQAMVCVASPYKGIYSATVTSESTGQSETAYENESAHFIEVPRNTRVTYTCQLKEGYKFLKWNDYSESWTEREDVYEQTFTTTVGLWYKRYDANSSDYTTYTITLVAGSYVSSVTGGGTKPHGASVTVTATIPSSTASVTYTFDGWYQSGVKVSSSLSYTFTATQSVTLTAIATIKYNGAVRIYHYGWQSRYGWFRHLSYIYHNGSWHFALPYIYTNNEWKLMT